MSSLHERRFGSRFYLLLLLWLLVTAAVQSRLPASCMVMLTAPDLVLALAVAVGLVAGPVSGAAAGFVGAYFLSAAVPFSPGSLFFSHTVAGFIGGLPRLRVYTENPLVPPAVGAVCGAASETLFYLVTPRSPSLWVHAVAVQAVAALVLTPLWYTCLQGPARRFELDEEPTP